MRQLKITKSITHRDAALNAFFKDIAQIPLLTVDEEVELAQKIKLGDEAAEEKLVTSNLRFVVSVAKQYQGQGLSLMDLISEGSIGLKKAAKLFDETKGFKFISYAVWWVRQSIMHALAENSRNIRIPANKVVLLSKINKEISKFEQDNERLPTSEELADILLIPADKIEQLIASASKNASIDAPLTTEAGAGTLCDLIENKNSMSADSIVERDSIKKEVSLLLQNVSDRERDIVRMYFGIGCKEMTVEEISDYFGVTSERVRQIKENVLHKLKKFI